MTETDHAAALRKELRLALLEAYWMADVAFEDPARCEAVKEMISDALTGKDLFRMNRALNDAQRAFEVPSPR